MLIIKRHINPNANLVKLIFSNFSSENNKSLYPIYSINKYRNVLRSTMNSLIIHAYILYYLHQHTI
jgi:hypothetical protein